MIRNNVKANYNEANAIMNSMPGFKVTELNNNIDKEYGLREEHCIKIENISNKKQIVSFVLKNTNKEFPYNYMNYSIVKNNNIVKEGILRNEGIFYETSISSNEDDIYTIILSISQEDINALGGITTYAEFTFI